MVQITSALFARDGDTMRDMKTYAQNAGKELSVKTNAQSAESGHQTSRERTCQLAILVREQQPKSRPCQFCDGGFGPIPHAVWCSVWKDTYWDGLLPYD